MSGISLIVDSEPELELLLRQARLSESFRGKASELTIEGSSVMPAKTIRAVLLALPNISSLILTTPCSAPDIVFLGVQLSKLTLLKTNLPHAVLVDFIRRTPTIRFLTLGCCGNDPPCGLRILDFRRIEQLIAPLECINGILYTTTVLSLLQQLIWLRSLKLTTSARMVSHGGSLSDERALITRWLTGRRKATSGTKFHPALLEIGILYALKRNPRSGWLSGWRRDGEDWIRIRHLGPDLTCGADI
ncbi:hypothetical protein EIP86_009580 [Pleurotus ostreatoroseus]|nr:hypothetical protein EIP86_009580 [Pleurotus ostreatoroseus]